MSSEPETYLITIPKFRYLFSKHIESILLTELLKSISI